MRAGLLLLAAAFSLSIYNIWDEQRAGHASDEILEAMTEKGEAVSSADTSSGVQLSDNASAVEDANVASAAAKDSSGETIIPDYVLNPDMDMPSANVKGNAYIGRLEIPRLGLSLPVMQDWSYKRLRIAPCRYAGTAYKGNFVIAAHNYRRHFGMIKYLAPGDRVTFTDMDGNLFLYDVAEVDSLQPTDVEEMTADGFDLTLFTCTIGGKTRIAVRCSKV